MGQYGLRKNFFSSKSLVIEFNSLTYKAIVSHVFPCKIFFLSNSVCRIFFFWNQPYPRFQKSNVRPPIIVVRYKMIKKRLNTALLTDFISFDLLIKWQQSIHFKLSFPPTSLIAWNFEIHYTCHQKCILQELLYYTRELQPDFFKNQHFDSWEHPVQGFDRVRVLMKVFRNVQSKIITNITTKYTGILAYSNEGR